MGCGVCQQTCPFCLGISALDIAYRITRSRIPRIDGMVERFNHRIGDVLALRRLHCGEDLRQMMLQYVIPTITHFSNRPCNRRRRR